MCAMPESRFGKGFAYSSIPSCDDTELRTQAHVSGWHSMNDFKKIVSVIPCEAPFGKVYSRVLVHSEL